MSVPTYETYEAAQAALATQAAKMVVCGTLKADQPVYFLALEDTPDDVIRDKSFEIRQGRAPSQYEQFLLAQAAAQRAEAGA